MQMKKSQLHVTKAYYSKAVKATVQKHHLRNKKSISNICVVVVLLFITGWVGVIIIKQYADKGRKNAYTRMDKIAFPDPCVGQQMRSLQ